MSNSLYKNIKMESNINAQTLDKLQTKLSQVKGGNKLIGGVNLIDKYPSIFGATGLVCSEYGFGVAECKLIGGRTYTFTACGCSSIDAVQNGQFLKIELYNSAWTFIKSLEFNETVATIKQITFTVPKTETYTVTSYQSPNKSNNKNVTVYWYNVQEGEIGTSWVPSLYDLNLKNGEEF